MQSLEGITVWRDERVHERLAWYYQVSTNRMPAKYLICQRIACEIDLKESGEPELWAEHERLTEKFLSLHREIRNQETRLAELETPGVSFMDLKVELAKRMLSHCNFCRWNCRVDRSKGTKHGTCQLESVSRVGSFFHHRGEELPIRGTGGSGTIFFTSCNLRCSFCLHPNTFVLTQRGPIRIMHLYNGAEFERKHDGGFVRFPENLHVFSYDGRLVQVTKIFKHDYEGDLIEIRPLYAPPIFVTPEHQILASEGPGAPLVKIPAAQLSVGEWLAIPRITVSTYEAPHSLDVTALISPRATESAYATAARQRLPIIQQVVALRQGGASSSQIATRLNYHPAAVRNLLSRIRRDGLPRPLKTNSLVMEDGRVRLKTEKRPGIPAQLEITEDLAEFLGYYCAEGHTNKFANRPSTYSTVISFGRHEMVLAKRVAGLIKRLFEIEAQIVHRRTTITVEISKSSLGLLMDTLCGIKARSKRVPEFLFQAPPNIVEAYLRAYSAGDGCVTKGFLSINTVSEHLAMGLFALYLRLGHLPSFNIYEPPEETIIEGRRVKQSTLYYVKVNVDRMKDRSWIEAKHVRYSFADDYILVPTYRIRRVPYSGSVYNLEVNDLMHSYTANFIAIGNCQNGDISHDRLNGIEINPRLLAAMMWQLRSEGCHNINLVGGEPTIHLHNIVEAVSLLDHQKPRGDQLSYVGQAKADFFHGFKTRTENTLYEGEFNVPILWNSNFFMSPETMKILQTMIDIWLPDFKFGSDKCSVFLSKTPWYMETVTRNHKLVYDWGEDMVIRHLVMPNHVECCTKPVLEWIANNIPKALVNVMDQYHPDYACNPCSSQFDPRYKELAREPYEEEILRAYRYAKELGICFEPLSYEKSMMGLEA